MKKELVGNMVFDTSTILELLYSTINGAKLKEALKAERIHSNISEVTITEAKYVLCRKLGNKEAQDRIKNLLDSGYISVHEDSKLIDYVAECKCKRRLSLADCFTLALARKMNAPALFAKREDELIKEMSKEPFDIEIWFLEDFSIK